MSQKLQDVKKRDHKKVFSDDLELLYPHELNLYRTIPSFEISLDEFKEISLERLSLLRILESASYEGACFTPEWKNHIYKEIKNNNLKTYMQLLQSKDLNLQARRNDHISHFILRVAFCESYEKRKWIVDRELELFKMRFMELSSKNIRKFMKLNVLDFDMVGTKEQIAFKDELINSTSGTFDFYETDFYKVHFTKVPELVRTRSVLLNAGFAYVPDFQMASLIATVFQNELKAALKYASGRFTSFKDFMFEDFLQNLSEERKCSVSTCQIDGIKMDEKNLDSYSKEHFPLCMSHIHEEFRKNHHLKHSARFQYLAFLKNAGVTLDDCMKFWKTEFTKKIDDEKFYKQYSYFVKYIYGEVGKMQGCSAPHCTTIIKQQQVQECCSGCPYHLWDHNRLKERLRKMNINENGVSEIVKLAQQGNYQLACGKYLQYHHNLEKPIEITKPNQYFNDSINLTREKD